MRLPHIIPTQKYQIALFPSDALELGFGLRNWSQLFTALVAIEDFSDGANTLLSTIPADVPKEVPRIILKSLDNRITCTVSPAKIDIFWENVGDNQEFPVSLGERRILAGKVVTAIGNIVKRVGSIQYFYFPLSVGVADPVRGEVFQENINADLRDYNLNLTYNVGVSETSCNWVLNLSNGTLSATDEDVISVTADLNTHQGTVLTWNSDQVVNFLNLAETYISKELVFGKIFPLR